MLQDTRLMYRNLLHFYTLILNYQKEKSGKKSHYNQIKKNKISRNKFNQGGERPVLFKILYENFISYLPSHLMKYYYQISTSKELLIILTFVPQLSLVI